LFLFCSNLAFNPRPRKPFPRALLAAACSALVLAGAAQASAPLRQASVNGFWQPPSGGRIEIAPCGDALCGHIRDDGIDGGQPAHTGHLLLKRLRYEGGLTWADGLIHNPRDRRTYRAKLRLLSGNQLKLTGCAWIFCGSQVWTRIE